MLVVGVTLASIFTTPGVGVGDGVGVMVAVGAGVFVGVGDAALVGVTLLVGVAVGASVLYGVGALVISGLGVGVGVGAVPALFIPTAKKMPPIKRNTPSTATAIRISCLFVIEDIAYYTYLRRIPATLKTWRIRGRVRIVAS